MSSLVTPNQSFLVKQMEWRLAAAFAAVMRGLHGNVMDKWGAWANPSTTLFWPTAWRKDHQLFKARLQYSKSGLHASMIGFSKARWDSQQSDLDYGEKSIDHQVDARDDAKTKIIHNDTDDPIHVAYEESVELTNSFSSTLTKGVTLDMTEDASVDTSLTVGAEYAGVKAEASVAAHFGISKSKEESEELGKEEAEEGTTSESLAIDFDAKPRSYYLVEIKKKEAFTSQPFDINGIQDFDIQLTRYDDRNHRTTYTFSGVDAFEQFVRGFDTDHPEMQGWWDKTDQNVKDAVAFILAPENRRIQVSGISHADLDSNADYDVELLGDHVPDGAAHLPVVSAINVGDDDSYQHDPYDDPSDPLAT